MDRTDWIATRMPESRAMFEQVKVATGISSKLSANRLDDAELIQEAFEVVRGPSRRCVHAHPPFYADHGLNITISRSVFIGAGCAFTGHAPIIIGDEITIGHKANLVTAGHPVEPDQRRSFITAAPIAVEPKAWIGAAATTLRA
jgi:acetyltransferase-like isoleucine patch superfamily enzyme